jgi:hypothetical protein
VECGQIESVSGDYITCTTGKAVCDGLTWGPCQGNRRVSRSRPSTNLDSYVRRTMAQSSDCKNPCDPLCTKVTGETSDVTGAGVDATNDGVSITPTTVGTGGPGSGPCRGLWCQVDACAGGNKTSLSGTVYDPAGKNPLYNAYVYIPVDPNAALPAMTEGVSCDTCAGAGSVAAIAVAQTGPDGKFKLENVPAGTGVPLVVQMGKWRRKVVLPAITPCVNSVVDKANSRLPRNRTDGAGGVADIPRMAIASGSADPFECLLLKAGIDATEIQLPGSGARIDYYRYNGKDRAPGGAPAGVNLTGSINTLKKYDVVLLPCEGAENNHNTQAPNLVSFAALGGRIFTTHYGYVWLATPSPRGVAYNLTEFYGTANWGIGRTDYNDPMTATIDRSFPKGQAYADWLVNVGASTTLGQMSINEPRHNALSAVLNKSQRWVYGLSKVATSGTPDMLLAMTFNTPVNSPPEQQCGRVVFSDFHVSADALVSASGCSNDTDCGFGSVCNPAVRGVCEPYSCTAATDCSSGYGCTGAATGACTQQACFSSGDCGSSRSCSGGVLGRCQVSCFYDRDCSNISSWSGCTGEVFGTCQAKACSRNSDCGVGRCSGGQCTTVTCTSNSDCGGTRACMNAREGTCSFPWGAPSCSTASTCSGYGDVTACVGATAGLCAPGSCYSTADCGTAGTCTGGRLGACEKLCTADAQCGTSLTCVSGKCQGCAADSACRSGNCVGDVAAQCSQSSGLFPLSCRNGDLTAQEKALEFMLFDLSACVSPDSWTPPAPSTEYRSVSFNLDFASDCPEGTLPLWREFQWQAEIPNSASIQYKVGTAEKTTALASATLVDLATTSSSTTLPLWDTALIETTTAGAFISANPRIGSEQTLRVEVTLNPTTDLKASPKLNHWQVVYDCKERL